MLCKQALLLGISFVAVIASSGALSAASAAAMHNMTLANWSGGSYSNDQTQRFSHCALTASYRSGTFLITSLNREWEWSLGFANPSWQLAPGTQIPVQVSFDGRSPYAGTATAIAKGLVQVPMAPSSRLIYDFRASRNMFVYANGTNFPFALTTTSRVMVALARCVKEELAYETGGPAPDLMAAASFAGPPQPLNPAQAAAVAMAPTSPPVVGALDRTLAATQIATNLLLQAGLPNAHLLNVSETPASLRGFGVAWTSDAGSGAVKIVDAAAGQTAQDVASQLISSDASVCKGDFESGRSSELVDNSIVTKAFVACRESANLTSARYLIYQGSPAHFVVFDTLSSGATASPAVAPPTERRVEAAALKAVSYQTWQ